MESQAGLGSNPDLATYSLCDRGHSVLVQQASVFPSEGGIWGLHANCTLQDIAQLWLQRRYGIMTPGLGIGVRDSAADSARLVLPGCSLQPWAFLGAPEEITLHSVAKVPQSQTLQ